MHCLLKATHFQRGKNIKNEIRRLQRVGYFCRGLRIWAWWKYKQLPWLMIQRRKTAKLLSPCPQFGLMIAIRSMSVTSKFVCVHLRKFLKNRLDRFHFGYLQTGMWLLAAIFLQEPDSNWWQNQQITFRSSFRKYIFTEFHVLFFMRAPIRDRSLLKKRARNAVTSFCYTPGIHFLWIER